MLDYLFTAETHNHLLIRQTQADVSVTDPKKSAFYDVLQYKVKRFSLAGKGHLFTVDLVDGHMEIDGRIIYPPKAPAGSAQLDLIYYRQIQQRLQIGPNGEKIMKPVIRYYIGWQTRYNGKNHKWELGID